MHTEKTMKCFTKKFGITKTIRMELKPENVHSQNLIKDYEAGRKNAINRAQDFAKAYVPVKKLLDDYYRFSINKILKNFDISENEINTLFDSYIKYKIDKKDKSWSTNTTNLRKLIAAELKELKSESSGSILENTKKEKSRISQYFNIQLDAGIITKTEFEQNTAYVERFKGFVGFFDGYMQNRENMFSDKTENTAIANRIVNENLALYFENCIKLEKIKQISPELYEEIAKKINTFIQPSDYSKLITQDSINRYNEIVGHKSDDKFSKGINQLINEYKQNNPEQRKNIGYFNKLHNQILFRDVESTISSDEFTTDEEVLVSLKRFIDNAVQEYFINAEKIFEDTNNLSLDGIYILPNKINKISEILFDGKDEPYFVLKHKLLEKEIDVSIPFSLKTVNEVDPGFDSVAIINNYLEKLIKNAKESIAETKILVKELLNGTKEFDKDRRVPKNEKDTGGKGFQQIGIIQNSFMKLIELNRLFTLFKLEKDGNQVTIEDVDIDFYENLKNLTSFDEDLYLFTKVKNYLSKKPYSNDKIRIYFDNNAKLLSGFSDSHSESDNGTQYGGYLFRRKNELGDFDYFLGCSRNAKLFREYLADTVAENDKSAFERLYYYQPKLKTIFRVYKNKDGNDYGYDKTKLKELIAKVADRSGVSISYEETDTPTMVLAKIKTINSDLYATISEDSQIVAFQKEMVANLKTAFSKFVNKVPSLENVIKKDFVSLKDFMDAVSYVDNEKSFYYAPVSKKEMDSQNEVSSDENAKKLYLFKIQNKDLKQRKDGKKTTGTENLHTMYFKALMSANQNCIDIGTGQVYFREKNYTGKEVIHNANEPIKNKTPGYPKETSTFSYDIRKDNRYFDSKFFLHLSLFINYASPNIKPNDFNIEVNKYLYKNKESVNIMGIDRGERNLLYVSIINQKGEILYQRSLNEICYSIRTNSQELKVSKDYHALLENRAKERDLARKSWGHIDNIKELKEGYLSQIVHELTLLMIRYNAVIVLEDLNTKFKQSRTGIDTQLYQKFEKALIDKLNYMAFKKDESVEGVVVKGGDILNGMQLATPITSFKDMKNQNGFIFYVWPQYTSKIDPVTGFVSLFDTREKTISEHISFFKKFKEISFKDGHFYFVVDDYSKFYSKKDTMPTNSFVIFSKGERIINKKNGRTWKSETIKPSEKLQELFEEYKIDLSKDILIQITETKLPLDFYSKLIKIFRSIVQLRNSETGNGAVDFILSPVVDENGNNTFDSRIELEKGKSAKLPVDADANGAYHIALKGLMAIKSITPEGTIKLSSANTDWFEFVQEKAYMK